MLVIGIDPGVRTGVAIKTLSGKWLAMRTKSLLEAQILVLEYAKKPDYSDGIFLVFEDARKRKRFGSTGRERLQGAGSVKRDSKIWEEFCQLHRINYAGMMPPKKITDKKFFNKITGWTGSTSQHARDAAMLIDGINEKTIKLIIGFEKV